MIEVLSKSIFHLQTDNTSYIIRILETGHAEHIYYGKRLRDAAAAVPAAHAAWKDARHGS